MKKNVCYAGHCNIVTTGFNIEQYEVCTQCKMEVSPDLARRIKEREEKLRDDNKIEKEDYDDMYDLMFGYSDYHDPLGD